MMMDRNRLGFWTRLIAIVLAAGFLISSVLIGFTATGSYNLLEAISGGQQEQQQQQQPQDLSGDISEAEQNLEENPEDPEAIKELATLYATDGQTSEAITVLEEGMDRAPEDAEIPFLLGQLHFQQAQAQPEGERADTFRQAGDAFAAATERDEKTPTLIWPPESPTNRPESPARRSSITTATWTSSRRERPPTR